MATKAPAMSLDQMLQESRKKREAQDLAQQILGKKNRSQTPVGPRSKPGPGASLASRVGIAKVRHIRIHDSKYTKFRLTTTKRTASLPRSNTAPPARNNRPPPQTTTRPALNDNHRTRSAYNPPPSEPATDAKSNGRQRYDAPPAANASGNNISFRGAANTAPHVVIAQNFAPGTSAEDIASVMSDVGGQVTECVLVSEAPTVIAEMTFADRAGAESVINTFNGKKADGRTLNVYLKAGGGAKLTTFVEQAVPAAEEAMEIDENAQAREAEDRLREERRGRNDRGGFPTGPRNERPYEDDYYNRGPRRAEPAYQDGRYGFQGAYSNGGRYRNDSGRMYSDRMGAARGPGQSWRP